MHIAYTAKTTKMYLVATAVALGMGAQAQLPAWHVGTYPLEDTFQRRIQGMLPRILAKGFGERSKAMARCPDTGLPVYTWALEGDSIFSPYTGRKFVQGPTGYFGPKQRDAQGRITAFGGDPLKYDLQPATAALLLQQDTARARAFLSIPGNLRQQYHFAAKNWTRLYGLLGHTLPQTWHAAFMDAVGSYAEARRPSDGDREHNPMSRPHNLVGERGHLLGGNMKDGGTENHKTMWRSSALVYGQSFPEGALISGVPAREAARITDSMLNDYVRKLALTGNGEYDSQIYYPHSIAAFLNVFDFAKDSASRTMAHAALDYYLATYGLKVYDGTIAGAQKRGFLPDRKPGEMELLLWTWGARMSRPMPERDQVSILHQTTSRYRPNAVLMNIINKNVALPYEAFMNRPWYHMNSFGSFQETFYASHSFGLGSVAMSMVDNPTQQCVWSLVAQGQEGPLALGGVQPRFLNPSGHSPYTQTLQKKGAIVIMTGATEQVRKGKPTAIQQQRMQHAADSLVPLTYVPDRQAGLSEWATWLEQAKKSASTWLFVPRGVTAIVERSTGIFMQVNQTLVYVRPLGGKYHWLRPWHLRPDTLPDRHPVKLFDQYQVLVAAGTHSGFVIEAGEMAEFGTLANFMEAISTRTQVATSTAGKGSYPFFGVSYRSLQGDLLQAFYEPTSLRCRGSINNKPVNYDAWAGGAVYQSPYVQVKDGMMQFTDGKEGYRIDCRAERPVFLPIQVAQKK